MTMYGTPEYEAWKRSVDERIRGRNAVVRSTGRRIAPPPANTSEDFKEGYQDHARLYGKELTP